MKYLTLTWRGVVLFFSGALFTIVLDALQSEHYALNKVEVSPYYPKWWLPIVCGCGSAFVGLLYPYLKTAGEEKSLQCHDWSDVLRCVTMFVGINEACIKVEFPSNLQLAVTLAILSVGLWWYFDRTTIGFVIGVSVAALAVLATQVLAYKQIYRHSEREFLFVQSWLPYIVFSGGVTVCNIGRKLAANDFQENANKSHSE